MTKATTFCRSFLTLHNIRSNISTNPAAVSLLLAVAAGVFVVDHNSRNGL